ncbi:MAG TPA: SRPBCC family protein [Trueperaceae bacterium]
MGDSSDDNLCIARVVPLPRPEAFALFTDGFGSWYPSIYTWSGDGLRFIGMEGRVGGHCFEVGPHDFRCDWGRVILWEPPERIGFTWQISYSRAPVPDPVGCSEIEVVWSPRDDGSTDLEFCHRHFARHGEEWAAYREAMASEGGWPYILGQYLTKAAGGVQPS